MKRNRWGNTISNLFKLTSNEENKERKKEYSKLEKGFKTLKIQNVMMQYDADSDFIHMPELFVRGQTGLKVPYCYDATNHCHIIKELEIADYKTYFNCLQMAKWKDYAKSEGFNLHIIACGDFSVDVFEVGDNSICTRLCLGSFNLSKKEEVVLKIPDCSAKLIAFQITAVTRTQFFEGWYSMDILKENINNPQLALVTTTFKKQDYITKNIRRLKKNAICAGSDLKGKLFVHVIDNERALDPSKYDCEDLKIYPNDNVGGAGGFTKGMIEAMARQEKPTHILLMDDDVLILPESLFRLYYLLRVVKPEYNKRFVSGAMFDFDFRERQYEDVGKVDPESGSYGPVKPTLDMRNPNDLLRNETFDVNAYKDTYAGWWFCCIPVCHIEERGLPMPVFIRGDDVEFSLRNNPGFLTLNGIAVWHIGFAGKFNAAMELYQVHRNSLMIQATADICRDAKFIPRIKMQFWKEITRFGYKNAELLLDSIDDYLKGPIFLMEVNGEASFQEHMEKNEKLVLPEEAGFPEARHIDIYQHIKLNIVKKIIYVITLNGHLLPNFFLKRKPQLIAFDWFFVPGKNFLRKTLVAVNAADRTVCVRTINRKECFTLIKRYRKVTKLYRSKHQEVEQEYRLHAKNMGSNEFWKGYLKYE